MPKINVTTAFEVRLADGSLFPVLAGESDVPDEVADNFFVKAHFVDTPKGRMPLVEGADGMMIEADEAGQRVGPAAFMNDAGAPPVRQEGPFSHQQVNRDAPASAMDGTPVPAGSRAGREAASDAEVRAAGRTPGPAGVGSAREAASEADLQAANQRLEATRLANPRPVPK